jgi:hypothetical protein
MSLRRVASSISDIQDIVFSNKLPDITNSEDFGTRLCRSFNLDDDDDDRSAHSDWADLRNRSKTPDVTVYSDWVEVNGAEDDVVVEKDNDAEEADLKPFTLSARPPTATAAQSTQPGTVENVESSTKAVPQVVITNAELVAEEENDEVLLKRAQEAKLAAQLRRQKRTDNYLVHEAPHSGSSGAHLSQSTPVVQAKAAQPKVIVTTVAHSAAPTASTS